MSDVPLAPSLAPARTDWLSPLNRRRLENFKANRRGWWALWIFSFLFVVTLFAEFVANDKPFLVSYDGGLYLPILKAYPDDEEVVAQNAMSEFQKVKQEKSINGNSTKGRSVKSGRSRGQMSIASERKIVQLQLPEEGVKEDEDGTEKSLETAYELENVEKQAQEQNIDQISGQNKP